MSDLTDKRKMRAESIVALVRYLTAYEPWTKAQFQKGMFLAELEAVEQGLRVPGFKFFRYKHGPYSKDLELLVLRLIAKGLAKDGAKPALTEAGREYARVLLESLPDTRNNRRILSVLEGGVRRVRDRRWSNDLKAEIYDMEILPMSDIYDTPMRIEDIPHYVDLVAPSEQAPNGSRLDIPLETIDIALYPLDMTSDEREAVFSIYNGDVSDLGLPT